MSVTVLTWAEYQARHGAVHDRTFGPGSLAENPFAPAGWARALLPGGLYLDADLLLALRQASASAGDSECVMVDRAGCFPDQPPMVLGFEEKDWDTVRSGTSLGHVEVEVFSASGVWALIASPEGFALLGAGSSFMHVFFGAVPGGSDEVAARVSEAIAAGEIGYGLEGRRYARNLLGAVRRN